MPEAQHYIKDRTTGYRGLTFPERTSFPTASTQALKGPKDERRGLRRSRVTGEDRAPALGALVRKRGRKSNRKEGREDDRGGQGEKGAGAEGGVTPHWFEHCGPKDENVFLE